MLLENVFGNSTSVSKKYVWFKSETFFNLHKLNLEWKISERVVASIFIFMSVADVVYKKKEKSSTCCPSGCKLTHLMNLMWPSVFLRD